MRKFFSIRVILLIILLLISGILIGYNPNNDGAAIVGVQPNTPAAFAGVITLDEKPTSLERVVSIDDTTITSAQDANTAFQEVQPGSTVIVTTHAGRFFIKEQVYVLSFPFLNTSNTSNTSNSSNQTQQVAQTVVASGLTLVDAPSTNIKKGLDLQGGTRILLSPEDNITSDEFELLKTNIEKRLNVFGLTDIRVTVVRDSFFASEPSFVLVEIAGVNSQQIEKLISQQGEFVARIGNETAFAGTDILAAQSSRTTGSLTNAGCQSHDQGTVCQYSFPVTVTQEAARRHADITRELSITPGTDYLELPLELYLDGDLVNSLQIGSSLKGRIHTTFTIQGSGTGSNIYEARLAATNDMKEMQSILQTGSLPSKLTIVRSNTISASLGKTFVSNALLVGLAAAIAICVVIFTRYRRLVIVVPMITAALSEVILLLGFAALVGWNLDLAAIAGIIIIIGTSIDHQIIITDEMLDKKQKVSSYKVRAKKAFFVIMTAYATSLVAMMPLLWAGAGLLKGFALTTIVGISLGVFITRPAYAHVAQYFLSKKN
ncbi:MAG: preprotein translocase subunit SecD [Candidatus Woesearchaeota archaeon]|jgi:preprotein translocase subunit SecD